MSRREQIRMTEQEVVEFIAERRTVVLATTKSDGRPHLVPMWFVPTGDLIELWSFSKAQKTLNMRRDPRATLLLETGDSYDQLRGISLECDVELLDDPAEVERIGTGLTERYAGGALDEQGRAAVRAQVSKRTGMRFTPTRTISWDHRKLGGAY